MASANKSPRTKNDTTSQREDSEYPDLNTPLNVPRASEEPGPEIWNEIPGDNADDRSDPMGFLRGLGDSGRGKKR